MTTTNQESIKNSINASNITFAHLAIANFYDGLFGELFEDLFSLPISDILKNPIVGIYYRQYGKLVIGFLTSDVDKNDDRRVTDNKVANNRAANNRTANNGAADGNDNQRKDNDQNSDEDYKEEQGELDHSKKGFFLDKTRFSTLVISKKALLDILGDVKLKMVTSDIDKKLTR